MPLKEDNIVKQIFDLKNPPNLTTEQKLRMDAIAVASDVQITLRIDSDVIDFFRNTVKRYQTRINAVLRSYMVSVRQLHPPVDSTDV